MGLHASITAARRLACAAVALLALAVLAAPARADIDSPIAGTPPECPTLPAGTCLLTPFFPDAPENQAAAANLGTPGSPEDDLAAALDDLSTADTPDKAQADIARALAILQGDPVPGAPYSGLPLLNWNLPAKVKDVPAGVPVDVREVRFGDHALLDTWMLRFADPTQPYTIRWHITELGTSFGGKLTPAVVPDQDGAGQQVAQRPLALPILGAGTMSHGRFHPDDTEEQTRLATQVVSVDMPAPQGEAAILDPNLQAGHETFAQIVPFDQGRLQAAQDTFGFSGPNPTADERDAAIRKLSDDAPEKQIWTNLKELDPAADLAAANHAGADDRLLVGMMRSRDTLPLPSLTAPGADVDVQFANDEAYVSRRSMRLGAGGSVTFSVANLDGFAHTFAVRQLDGRPVGRDPEFGALDWGHFTTSVLKTVTVPANSTAPVTVTVTPPDDAFSLWAGDPGLGDQTGMAVALDRGPRTESLSLGEPFSAPLHQALDQDGDMWVTLSGLDALERFTPQDDLSSAQVERFPLPGGSNDPNALFFEPTDVAVDGHGTVWSTLALGNGIARLDRAQARPGTSDGIRIYPLEPCTETICRPPPPPPEPGPLSRLPLQMKVTEDGAGNTLVWFTEQLADRIGLLRIAPDGTKLNEVHYPCGCTDPLGLDLDAEGNVWFTENRDNRIGRLTVDPSRPYNASAIDIAHFDIPSGAPEFDIGLPLCPAPGQTTCTPPGIPNPVISSAPHSLSIDRQGRVWFSEELTRKMAYLDPAAAKPGTTDGMHEFDLDTNDFNRTPAPADMVIDRAGTVHYSDEYGDIIGRIRADGTQPRGFRPLERQSLTDSPVTDPAGNLWFVESGSSMVTRISGVTAGLPLPAATPLITADTAAGRLTASGLREMTSVDVRVVRGTGVAGSATGVPLVNGGFSVAVPLRGDDRVEIVPDGPNARAPFWFRVADLSATVDAGGLVTGTARSLGQALPERVQIAAGSASGAPAISADDGSFSWTGPAGAAGGGTLSFTGATPMARFRTVTPFGAFAPPPATGGGTSGAPGAGAPGGGAPVGGAPVGGAPVGGAPAPAPGGPPATPAPQPRPPAAPPRSAPTAAAPACARPAWLARARSRRTVPLLGMTRGGVQRCFGAPARRTRHGKNETWTYRRTLTVRFRRGRVVSFTVGDRTMGSRPDRAAVGAPVARFRRAVGRLAADGRRGQRGLVPVRGGYADVRLAVRSGRVRRIVVTRVSRRALDRTGRALARRLR